ncbi:hypothetical protein [Fulvimarina sp. MAC8]|uniref:hypothetical protein n=1 Tax=Fulvimarina sp. MAC8 TaxID=3162874 RepID=UPI0032EAF150
MDATCRPGEPDPAYGTFIPVLLLQIVNSKTWVFAATNSAAHVATGGSLAILVALTATVPAACLAVWAVAGRAIAPLMERALPRRMFAALMGSVLAGFAVALVVPA